MSFLDIGTVVHAVGRVTPNGVRLLGTATLAGPPGHFVTAGHVTGGDERSLVIVLTKVHSLSAYQDTSDQQIRNIPARIAAMDPFRDLCVLSIGLDISSSILISGTDHLTTGHNVAIFGYPHADYGRMVLTHQITEIGAKILIESGNLKSKHVVLNIQSRPGQSGSPIFDLPDNRLVAVLIGSYAPGGGGQILLGDIDPSTLHQTTHAISAEYVQEMLR